MTSIPIKSEIGRNISEQSILSVELSSPSPVSDIQRQDSAAYVSLSFYNNVKERDRCLYHQSILYTTEISSVLPNFKRTNQIAPKQQSACVQFKSGNKDSASRLRGVVPSSCGGGYMALHTDMSSTQNHFFSIHAIFFHSAPNRHFNASFCPGFRPFFRCGFALYLYYNEKNVHSLRVRKPFGHYAK